MAQLGACTCRAQSGACTCRVQSGMCPCMAQSVCQGRAGNGQDKNFNISSRRVPSILVHDQVRARIAVQHVTVSAIKRLH